MVFDVEECGVGGGELRGLTLYSTLPDLEAVVGVVIVKSGQFNVVVVVDVVVVAIVFEDTMTRSAFAVVCSSCFGRGPRI